MNVFTNSSWASFENQEVLLRSLPVEQQKALEKRLSTPQKPRTEVTCQVLTLRKVACNHGDTVLIRDN